MSIIEFSDMVHELTPFTNNMKFIDRGLRQLRPGTATAFYNALVYGVDRLGVREGRRVLVVISDGNDDVDEDTYPQALKHALNNDVMIYSLIDVPILASAGRSIGGEHAMITLSEQTGGRYFYIDQGGLDEAFQHVSEDLRTQYLIAYYPRHEYPGMNFHRIEVTMPKAAPGAYHLRYRTGYYTNEPESSH
jgi:Ca-activated chloride channel family protein